MTIMQMQTPQGAPLSPLVEPTPDPLLPPQTREAMLEHFYYRLYDTRPESHLSRILAVLLGETGTGGLRKKFTYWHLSQSLLTAHFYDLDRLFADTFGVKRFLSESLSVDPYLEPATDEDWEALIAADASYRSRVEEFMRGVNWGPTPNGMVLCASAILGHEVRIYESYSFIDDAGAYVPPVSTPAFNTYGDLESYLYLDMQGKTYSELEGTTAYHGRALDSRSEFIIRPLRPMTAEERYHLIRALDRLKPAEAMMTIDPNPPIVYTRVEPSAVSTDSAYWHVQKKVVVEESQRQWYPVYLPNQAVQQPRPAFSQKQTDEWYYNRNAVSVRAYVLSSDGATINTDNIDYERSQDTRSGDMVDYVASNALLDQHIIALGQAAQDGSVVAPPVQRVVA